MIINEHSIESLVIVEASSKVWMIGECRNGRKTSKKKIAVDFIIKIRHGKESLELKLTKFLSMKEV